VSQSYRSRIVSRRCNELRESNAIKLLQQRFRVGSTVFLLFWTRRRTLGPRNLHKFVAVINPTHHDATRDLVETVRSLLILILLKRRLKVWFVLFLLLAENYTLAPSKLSWFRAKLNFFKLRHLSTYFTLSCSRPLTAVSAYSWLTSGATENARPGKCRTWKMTDQIAGLENAGPNNFTSCWVCIKNSNCVFWSKQRINEREIKY